MNSKQGQYAPAFFMFCKLCIAKLLLKQKNALKYKIM